LPITRRTRCITLRRNITILGWFGLSKWGWFVLDKYYNMTEEAPVYAAALLLDSSRRAAYIRKNWPVGWVEPAIEAAHGLWDEKFKAMLVLDDLPPQLSMPPPAKPSQKRGAELDLLMKVLEVIPADLRDDDDFKTFVESSPFRIDCRPLEWWSRSEQKSRYPHLYHMVWRSYLSRQSRQSLRERFLDLEGLAHGID
jgi:hypothetical protein